MRNPSGCCSYERLFLGLDGLLGGFCGDPAGLGGSLHKAIGSESTSHSGCLAFPSVVGRDVFLDGLEAVSLAEVVGLAGRDAEFLVSHLEFILCT